MRGWPRREPHPELPLAPGEKLLAWGFDDAGTPIGGTRVALYLPGRRLAWEDVQAADWDRDTELLRVAEVGAWGQERVEHTFTIDEPGLLLELIRERITASIVYQRHFAIRGRRGLRVIARRAPHGDNPIRWIFEYDEGVDPEDPEVRTVAAAALSASQVDLGL